MQRCEQVDAANAVRVDQQIGVHAAIVGVAAVHPIAALLALARVDDAVAILQHEVDRSAVRALSLNEVGDQRKLQREDGCCRDGRCGEQKLRRLPRPREAGQAGRGSEQPDRHEIGLQRHPLQQQQAGDQRPGRRAENVREVDARN